MSVQPSRAPSPASQLRTIHGRLRVELPGVSRIAVAVYDPKSDSLKTYLHSTEGDNPLPLHDARLADVPSLARLARSGADRVLNDLSSLATSDTRHSQAVHRRYGSSFTRPVYDTTGLSGFLFFDADDPGYFTPSVVARLGIYAEFVMMILAASRVPAQVLQSTVAVASRLSHSRDPETGAHLDRMARYSRVIALELATTHRMHQIDDPWVEHLLLFAPMHDIGKVAIPDRVLLKPGPLDDEELRIMRSHVDRGAELIESVIDETGLRGFPHVEMLFNIIRHHHESWDGGGYPRRLAEEAIPLEARIVKVADVLDALTSVRPYKPAWSMERSVALLVEQSGRAFDPKCVEALLARRTEVEEIRARFVDHPERVHFHEGYSVGV